MKVVFVGDCGIDEYQDDGEERPGGCTLNLAVNWARLAPPDIDFELVSAVGSDEAGDCVLRTLYEEGIPHQIARLAGATPKQVISVDQHGERKFIAYDPGVLAEFHFDLHQQKAIETADVVVTLLYQQIEPLLKQLAAIPRSGRLVCDFMDMTDYDKDLNKVKWLLDRTDIAFFGLDPVLDDHLIDSIADSCSHRASEAIVTLGHRGGIAFAHGQRQFFDASAALFVADSTGAGDAFAAAFLCKYLGKNMLKESLAFAAEHAARTLGHRGAFAIGIR